MSSNHVTESLPAYALGALDESERRIIAAHLALCPACQAELSSYQAVVDQLPLTVPQRTPPARVRSAVERHLQPGVTTRPAWVEWLLRPSRPALALIGILVIVILAATNLILWQQVQQLKAPLNQPVVERFHLVPLKSHTGSSLHGAQPASEPAGLLVIGRDGRYGILVVDGLAPLDSTRQYQLWLVKDGQRTNGGVFSVQSNGHAMVEIESAEPLSDYQSFGVTIEPFGGSPGPTGENVLGSGL